MVSLGGEACESGLLIYINRLSDLLFVMARAVNRRAGAAETEW
jgi:cob(I)alamin adenosyltransferase